MVDLLYRLNLPADAQSGTLTATVDVEGAPEDFLPIVAAATLPVTVELRAFALAFNPQRVQVRGGNPVSVTVSLEPAMRTTLAENEIVTVVMTADSRRFTESTNHGDICCQSNEHRDCLIVVKYGQWKS